MRTADIIDLFIDAWGTGPFTRTDLRRWVNIDLGLSWTDRDATDALQTHRLTNQAMPDGLGGYTPPAKPTRHVLERVGFGPSTSWRKAAPADHAAITKRAVIENLERIRLDLNVRAQRVSDEDPVEAARYVADSQFIAAGLALLESAIATRA